MNERIRSDDILIQSRKLRSREGLTSCPEFPPPISMLAPPEVGGAPALVPLICEASFRSVNSRNSCRIRTHLNVPQFHTIAIGASPIDSVRVTGSVEDRPAHNQGRPITSRGVPLGGDFLIRSGKIYR